MALPASGPASSLDFEALLSRTYEPAPVTRIQLKPNTLLNKKDSNKSGLLASSGGGKNAPSAAASANGGSDKSGTTTRLSREQLKLQQQQYEPLERQQLAQELSQRQTVALGLTEDQREFIRQLVTQTPAFLQHLTPREQERVLQQRPILLNSASRVWSTPNTGKSTALLQHQQLAVKPQQQPHIPAQFTLLELSNWESKINWGDEDDDDEDDNRSTATSKSKSKDPSHKKNTIEDLNPPPSTTTSSSSEHNILPMSATARALLERKRNPFLDTLQFDESTICWDGDPMELAAKAAAAPLILELGVAGQSVAHKVYQSTVMSAQRPVLAIQQEAYQARLDREWAANGGGTATSTAELSKAHHLNKQELSALIEARQRKREQMAKDKTNRVTAALGTLALGGGKGRTITSSLMGPGGTERTGRPSRHMNAAGAIEHEYIEQLELVQNHSLVRDLSKVLLRQFHRPKLPMAVVRQDLSWQFQVRYSPQKEAALAAAAASAANPYFGGHHHQAVNPQTKLRTEADLSPSEGKLIVVEYSEERPPIQLSKGMCFKIINYFRGDKSQCPVSAGGGDRPARKKRTTETSSGTGDNKDDKAASNSSKQDRLPRLTVGMTASSAASTKKASILDWIGPLPKKGKDHSKKSEEESIDILPEGVTEILHANVHGPFLGEVPEGTPFTGLISNLFVAPMFRHEPESTDFLMILTPPGGATRAGQRENMGVILRDFPRSIYTVGQTEPTTRVHAPSTPGEKQFTGPYVSYHIARAIARSQSRDGHGLRLDELQARVLPNLELPGNAFRQRLRHVAVYDKNTQIWTTKQLGFEGYPGIDTLAKNILPEGVAAFETTCAAGRRLSDLGINHLYSGANTATSVGVTMVYLAGQMISAKELSKKAKRLVDASRSNKDISSLYSLFCEKAADELESAYKMLRNKHEVAQFIHEELLLAPWHLSGEFIDVHKKAEGTGMMKLTGLGDPSGKGEGFSFLREADSKPSKSVGNVALNAQVKKITGTEDDLRKLTMPQMASLLRSYGMAQKQIDTLKRWDRVHCIRDLSTKAASDGIASDGLERFARGEKLKLSEQKQMYRDRIKEIWRRQIAALASDLGEKGGVNGDLDGPDGAAQSAAKKMDGDNDGSDSESDDDDDFFNSLEQEMMGSSETNQLVAAHTRGTGSDAGYQKLRAAAQDQDLSKDAHELNALRKQMEEERAAQEVMKGSTGVDLTTKTPSMVNRKVIRRRITKTHPDGRQTVTFKFILHPEEVGKIQARLAQKKPEENDRSQKEWNYQHGPDEKPPGHTMFEDEDDFEYSRGRKPRRPGGARGKRDGRITPRARGAPMLGKLKTKVSKEERMRKRKKEEEELEVYNAQAKRKSTNNRRERGSIRDRRPHVIFAQKLEAIRSAVESRPYAGPFQKPVNPKILPKYYEVISYPIDLQTIRDRISHYQYKKVDTLLKDFELMKNNAIKFNGESHQIALEGVAIYDFVRDQIQASRSELAKLEDAVEDQMSGKPKKKRKTGPTKKTATGMTADIGGVTVALGDVKQFEDDSDSGEDDEMFLGAI